MTEYSEALVDAVCDGLSEGKSLIAICAEQNVACSSVYKWLTQTDKTSFAERYALARETQADYLADAIVSIADESTADPNDRRVRIDARKWYAGKLRPKKYGDKVDLNHGGQENNPVQTSLTISFIKPATPT